MPDQPQPDKPSLRFFEESAPPLPPPVSLGLPDDATPSMAIADKKAVFEDTKAFALLLIHEQAEEIKQTTICMRQVYPGCRVEAVYSAEEALQWGPKQEWGVILLDEQLANRTSLDLLPELRRQAPSSVIVVQTEHHDAETAAKALRAGADLFLYKKSPAYLTELPIVTRSMLEQRALQKELLAARERHSGLIQHFPGLLFELDAEGRFVAVGAGITALLGYSPQELTGTHYSTLLHPDEWRLARHHLHERRTGPRAQHDKAVRLIGKHGGAVKVDCHTAGLYGRHRQFLGTVGIIKHQVESASTTSAPPRPYEPAPQPAAMPGAAPGVREPHIFYPERRRATRIPVHMEAALHLRDTAFSGFVLDISLSDLRVMIQGSPSVKHDQPVRLDFLLEGAILQVQGRISAIRHAPTPAQSSSEPSESSLVILYTSLGVIEGPILASLLQELRARPNCATLTIFPFLSPNTNTN